MPPLDVPGPRRPRGELRRRAFARVREGWRTVVVATAIVVVPLELLVAYLQRAFAPLDEAALTAASLGAGGAAGVLASLAEGLIMTPVVTAAAVLVLTRRVTDADALLGRAFRTLGRILLLILLAGLACLLPMVPAGVVAVVAVVGAAGGTEPAANLVALGIVLFAAGAAVTIFVALSFTVSWPVALVEDRTAAKALRESWLRMRGHRWPVLRTYLVLGLLVGVPVLIVFSLIDAVRQGVGPAAWSLVGLGSVVFFYVGTLVTAGLQAVVYDDTLPVGLGLPLTDGLPGPDLPAGPAV